MGAFLGSRQIIVSQKPPPSDSSAGTGLELGHPDSQDAAPSMSADLLPTGPVGIPLGTSQMNQVCSARAVWRCSGPADGQYLDSPKVLCSPWQSQSCRKLSAQNAVELANCS